MCWWWWCCLWLVSCVGVCDTELYLSYKAGSVSLRNALHRTQVEALGSGTVALVSHCSLGKDDYRIMHEWVQAQLPPTGGGNNVSRACRLEMADQLREEWLGWFRWCNYSRYEPAELEARSWKSETGFNNQASSIGEQHVSSSLPRIAYVLVLSKLYVPFSFRQMSALWSPENTLVYAVPGRDVVAASNAAAALGSNVYVARIEDHQNTVWIVYRAMSWLVRRRRSDFDFLVLPRPDEYPTLSSFRLAQLLSSLERKNRSKIDDELILTADHDRCSSSSSSPSSSRTRERSVSSSCLRSSVDFTTFSAKSGTRKLLETRGSHNRVRAFVYRQKEFSGNDPFVFSASVVRDFVEDLGVRRLVSFLKYSSAHLAAASTVWTYALRVLGRGETSTTTQCGERPPPSGRSASSYLVRGGGAYYNATLLDWIDDALLGDDAGEHASFAIRTSGAATAGEVEAAKTVYSNARVRLAHDWSNAH